MEKEPPERGPGFIEPSLIIDGITEIDFSFAGLGLKGNREEKREMKTSCPVCGEIANNDKPVQCAGHENARFVTCGRCERHWLRESPDTFVWTQIKDSVEIQRLTKQYRDIWI